MRPSQNQNQNRRMRGRNRNNKGPNPLTRSYDSNGPDVKIRGTAQHIADKYSQLARDAQVSGDPVAAENYFQHAEHYYRIIAAAQEQFRPAMNGYQRPFDDDGDEGDDEVSGYGAERPAQERGAQGGFNAQNGAGEEDFGSQPQPFEGRFDGGAPRFDRGNRQERQDRQEQRGDRYDRQETRPDRGDRFDRGDRRDRFPRNDRGGDRPPRGEYQPRAEQPPRAEGPRADLAPREEAPRERTRDEAPRRERPREEADLPAPTGLPAFLTNPTRPALAVVEAPPAPEPAFPASEENPEAAAEGGRFPRRRRRRRVDASEAPAGGESGDTAAE